VDLLMYAKIVGMHSSVVILHSGYELITILLGMVGALGFLATGYAVIRTNLTSQTIRNLELNNAALQERIQLIEDSSERLKLENLELRTQNTKQAQEIAWLTNQVTGASAIATLESVVTAHHTEVTQRLDDIDKNVRERTIT